ncbi:hypothetical protein ACQP2E_12060 [Actinoplanes sp. CA-015351]|uniref:hypothetical protein n=1 Tax=Actinoplanes sp. CA-015351 TaxID=3239897 RepID=UPI003D96C285
MTMCNPRRIRVRASRQLAEAWRAEVTRTAQASDTATGEARLTQPLGRQLPGPVRQRLVDLLRATPGWRVVDGALRREMPGGYVEYRPDTGEVAIVARVTAEFTVEASATRADSGEAQGTADAEFEASYYTDGYAGRTKAVAEREANEKAGQDATVQARENALRNAEAERAAALQRLQEAAADIDEEARARALAAIEEERARREADARNEAALLAQTYQQDYLREINLPLAQAYRDILVAHAQRVGAGGLTVQENGDFIDIQFNQREA